MARKLLVDKALQLQFFQTTDDLIQYERTQTRPDADVGPRFERRAGYGETATPIGFEIPFVTVITGFGLSF